MFEPMSSRPHFSRGKKQNKGGGHAAFETSMANSESGQRTPIEQHFRAALKKAENAVKMEEIEGDLFQEILRDGKTFLEMSEEEIADELRVSHPRVNRWLHGKDLPRRRVRKSIVNWVVDQYSTRMGT
jgi:ribosome-binding protein aMBF1 (putative translation factor)